MVTLSKKESACSSQIKGNIVTYVENTKSVSNSKWNFSSNKSLLPLALVKGKFSFGLLSSKKEISNATYTLFPTYEEMASAQYKYYSQRKLKKKISVGSKNKMFIKAEGRMGLKTAILGTKKHIKGSYSFTRQWLHHFCFPLLKFFPNPREVWLFSSLRVSLHYCVSQLEGCRKAINNLFTLGQHENLKLPLQKVASMIKDNFPL